MTEKIDAEGTILAATSNLLRLRMAELISGDVNAWIDKYPTRTNALVACKRAADAIDKAMSELLALEVHPDAHD